MGSIKFVERNVQIAPAHLLFVLCVIILVGITYMYSSVKALYLGAPLKQVLKHNHTLLFLVIYFICQGGIYECRLNCFIDD